MLPVTFSNKIKAFFSKTLLLKLAVTLAYLGFVLLLYFLNIPCLFRYFFHIPCPFCGMTHAFLSVLRLDFAAAWGDHPMVFAMPLLYLLFLSGGILFGKKAEKIIFYVILALFLICWIVKLALLFF